jgi:predicted GH43/DUF377 family glycosyl hydrolase
MNYYQSLPGKRCINEAISFNGVRWYQLTGQPLLCAGGEGSFDENGISKACVIKDKDGYKMYYYSEDKDPHAIGLATSVDGFHWTKYSDNPVLAPGCAGCWDNKGVWAPSVTYEGGNIYRMYYQGYDGEYASIGYATSTDGVHWEKFYQQPVLKHGDVDEFDEMTSGEPNVLYAAGRYHMFYTGADAASRNKIGYAYSEDGIKWTKHDKNPILEAGPSYWDYQSVAAPTVIYRDSIFHMWYSGWSAGQAVNVGYAISFLDTTILKSPSMNTYRLNQNFPNPFNSGTHINYNLPIKSHVLFKIYDLLGREITTLEDNVKEPGDYMLDWNAEGVSSGIYFYRIVTESFSDSKKMTLKK